MILFGIIFGALLSFIVIGSYVISLAFWIWMIVDAAKQDRFWWLVFIICVPIIAAAVYYFTEKKHEYRKAEVHHIHESQTEEQHEQTPKKRVRKAKVENGIENKIDEKKETQVKIASI
jgi:hypothetical protein